MAAGCRNRRMNENNVFDDISRTLASSIPRRQALRQIQRGLAAAALVSVFGVGTARAHDIKCARGRALCDRTCCPKGWHCCHNTTCCHPSQHCDGRKCKSSVSPCRLRSDGR